VKKWEIIGGLSPKGAEEIDALLTANNSTHARYTVVGTYLVRCQRSANNWTQADNSDDNGVDEMWVKMIGWCWWRRWQWWSPSDVDCWRWRRLCGEQ